MSQSRLLRLSEDQAILCELPVHSGSEGPDVIDVQALYRNTGMFTYDPGFNSTASCRSTITYIDGDQGILLYRGYPIEQLAEQCHFLEVCYLILKGELPSPEALQAFEHDITMQRCCAECLTRGERAEIDAARAEAAARALAGEEVVV